MQRKSLYRTATPEELKRRNDVERSTQFDDAPRVHPTKPPKGAKRKAKR